MIFLFKGNSCILVICCSMCNQSSSQCVNHCQSFKRGFVSDKKLKDTNILMREEGKTFCKIFKCGKEVTNLLSTLFYLS